MSGNTVIRVGGSAPVFSGFADFFDGEAAIVRRSGLSIEETASGPMLILSPPDRPTRCWPLAEIRSVPDQAADDIMVLARQGDPVSRLLIADTEAARVLTARCASLKKRPTVSGKARLMVWSAAALTSVVLIIFVLIPVMADQLAEFLPPEGEKALGDSTFEQIRSALGDGDLLPVRLCVNPAGQAALARMQARLEAQADLPYPLSVHVLDHDLINAFALPGGRIVFFRGLIDAAENPDELAAVFAHEIGHVVNRDPTRGALRSAGSIGVLGLLFGDFAGGTAVLFMVERLIDASYSQAAEATADDFAHATLAAAGITPAALATMFQRLRDENGDADGIVMHFLSHPRLGDRIAAANLAGQLMTRPAQPSLDETDWQDLRRICQ